MGGDGRDFGHRSRAQAVECLADAERSQVDEDSDVGQLLGEAGLVMFRIKALGYDLRRGNYARWESHAVDTNASIEP